MTAKFENLIVVHRFNGHADDITVEVDGKTYIADPDDPSKQKLDDDGKPIEAPVPAPPETEEEKKAREEKEKKEKTDAPAFDTENASLTELAKVNPLVAKMLDNDSKRIKDEAKAKEEDAKKKGEWQGLAEGRGEDLKVLQKKLDISDTLLGKYKGSVEKVLEGVMKTIPEEKRGLVPENFSPRQRLEYIITNAKLLGAKVLGGEGQLPTSDDQPELTDEAQLAKEITELEQKENRTTTEDALLWEKAKKLKELREQKKT